MFDSISSDAVTSFHHLYHLLRKLKIMGTMKTETIANRLSENGRKYHYSLRFLNYDPSTKRKLTREEQLDMYFILSEEIEACVRQTE